MLALLFQLERTQWWPAERLIANQFHQLRALVGFAAANVPWYRNHLRKAQIVSISGLSPASFRRWPILERADVRAAGDQLLARNLPREHGDVVRNATTGSTGQPVRVANSEAGVLYQTVHALRSNLWYGLDLAARYGAIRAGAPEAEFEDWGLATRLAFQTGPMSTFGISNDIAQQLQWLCDTKPAYLLSLGNNLRSLIIESRRSRVRPEGLRALLSYADRLPDDLRLLAREEWGVPVFDTYSAAEFGPLALQCPDHEHLHVQSENLLLEILREDGTPCDAGETGRVVVTDLHNFAMPLIRYDIGDYAETGSPCPCGRGLPVIRRIAGRASNVCVDPTGRRFWPLLSPKFWLDTPILQRQLIQHSAHRIEVRYVADAALTADEKSAVAAGLSKTLRYEFEFEFTKVEAFERSPGGKFQEFVSAIGTETQ